MRIISAFITGLIFGIGLIISGMTNPAKIIGFLDITGQWDPSLLLVMLGAVSISFFAFRFVERKPVSLLGDNIQLPKKTGLDKSLILGAVLFGIGWGLAGYCPGPALASLSSGLLPPVLFVLTMITGMGVFEIYKKLSTKK
ncbi:MAG: DUF6691 family protein [Methylophilus sp.]